MYVRAYVVVFCMYVKSLNGGSHAGCWGEVAGGASHPGCWVTRTSLRVLHNTFATDLKWVGGSRSDGGSGYVSLADFSARVMLCRCLPC